tara:strand:+ start:1398 stop:1823 length:426 start_codon:yes stop_codon:yes gene_type:complete
MEIDYLSERHRVIVEIYIAEVKKTMYYATDCENVGKYGDFIDLSDTVFSYSNNFFESMNNGYKGITTSEFLFLIPNMLFYTSIGFIMGIKNSENKSEMDFYIEKVTTLAESAIGDLADVLIDSDEGERILKESADKQLSKN